jgi:hypothetical protein
MPITRTSKLILALASASWIHAIGPAAADGVPRIAPIFSKPGGQTYGRWAAGWWQWALGVPAATNPLLDNTGEHCAERQVDGTWFLAGSLTGPVVRACDIPEGKALFFPLINNFYGAALNDSPEIRTETYIREQASCKKEFPVELSAEIDGRELRGLDRFFTGASGSQSPLFNVQLPPGNIFGVDETIVPELVLSPSAEQGYYLFVRPLSPGEHTVHWHAEGCAEGLVQDITYDLTIVPAEDEVAHEQGDAEGRVGGMMAADLRRR